MILNLTQHIATPSQLADGVVDLSGEDLATLKQYLNFVGCPDSWIIASRASAIRNLAVKYGAKEVMIGGAPYLMGPLEAKLKESNIDALYSFSERSSVETIGDDGKVAKTTVFEHTGWIRVQ